MIQKKAVNLINVKLNQINSILINIPDYLKKNSDY